jgi:hypothetical protein
MGESVHQHRGLGDVGEQDELVLPSDLGEESEHRGPLLLRYPVLLDHPMQGSERIR